MKNKLQFLLLSFFILIIIIIGGCELYDILPTTDDQPQSVTDAELTISFIDVGQGDATLIECGDEAMLIDAGLYSERYRVVNYLSQRGIENLKYCVATHPHADHIGGMSEVIYTFETDTLVYPLCNGGSDSFNYTLDACDEKGVSYLNPNPLDTLSVGKATVTVLSPKAYADYDNLNNNSLVLKLEYEDVSFLFMADAEKDVEKELLNKGYDLNADVLKAGHHGSSTSSSPEFINAVTPSVSVISCGIDNDYGHPHKETVSTFKSRDIKMYRTDKLSTIIAESDGESITFSTENRTLGTIFPKQVSDYSYIGNKKTKVFHLSACESVAEMNIKNKVDFINREDAVKKGYSPCKSCYP